MTGALMLIISTLVYVSKPLNLHPDIIFMLAVCPFLSVVLLLIVREVEKRLISPVVGIFLGRQIMSTTRHGELLRKLFHGLSAIIIVIYLLFGGDAAKALVLAAFLFFYTFDVLRMFFPGYSPFGRLTRLSMMRNEYWTFGPHTYFAVSATLVMMAFPVNIAVASVMAAAIGDAMAAVVGSRMGKMAMEFSRKTMEGFIAGLLSTFVVLLFFINPIAAIAGAAVFALVDLMDTLIDDNLLNSLVIATTVTFITILLS